MTDCYKMRNLTNFGSRQIQGHWSSLDGLVDRGEHLGCMKILHLSYIHEQLDLYGRYGLIEVEEEAGRRD